MRQGTRTTGRWIVGFIAVASIAAAAAADIASDGMAWQAGPLQVTLDMKRDHGLAIRFEKPLRHKTEPSTGFADALSEQAGGRG